MDKDSIIKSDASSLLTVIISASLTNTTIPFIEDSESNLAHGIYLSCKMNCANLFFYVGTTIDGQVHLVYLQTDNFGLFLHQQRTNDKLPFAPSTNSKQIKENRLGFHFPIGISMSMPPCLHASIS